MFEEESWYAKNPLTLPAAIIVGGVVLILGFIVTVISLFKRK